jgi:hypothetical protein
MKPKYESDFDTLCTALQLLSQVCSAHHCDLSESYDKFTGHKKINVTSQNGALYLEFRLNSHGLQNGDSLLS